MAPDIKRDLKCSRIGLFGSALLLDGLALSYDLFAGRDITLTRDSAMPTRALDRSRVQMLVRDL